jgi:hypothetical protein
MVSELSTWQSLKANQSAVGVSTCDKSANLEGDGLAREGLYEAVLQVICISVLSFCLSPQVRLFKKAKTSSTAICAHTHICMMGCCYSSLVKP